ncbi:hypothetical protein NKG94_51530 [Micromonospora sp. M12]
MDALTLGDASPARSPTTWTCRRTSSLTTSRSSPRRAWSSETDPRVTAAGPTCGCAPKPWPR